jgi:hypothetical protein
VSIIHSAIWSVALLRTSPVVGSKTSTPPDLDGHVVAVDPEVDVGFTEHREQVAGAGLLELLAHKQVGVHPDQEHRDLAEGPLAGDVEALIARDDVFRRADDLRVEREPKDAEQIEVLRAHRGEGRGFDERRRDRAVLRPDADPHTLRRTLGRVISDADSLDVLRRVRLHHVEQQPLVLPTVLDAGDPQVVEDRLLERRRVRIERRRLLRGRLDGR